MDDQDRGALKHPPAPPGAAPPRAEIDAAKFPALPGIGIDLVTLGRTLVQSGYFSDMKQISQAIVKVLAGQELGIGPIRAMTDIHVVHVKDEGGPGRSQVALGATLMASLIQRSGRFDYRILQFDDKACEIEFYEIQPANGGEKGATRVPLGRSRFTMDDAKLANLAGKANWRQYPRNMLFSRAMSNGAKWFCSAVFGGAVYTPEEIRDIAPEAEAPDPVPAPAPDAPPAPEPERAQEERPEGEAAQAVRPDADPGVEGARQPPPPPPPPPERRPGEAAVEARAREMTWTRMVRAMASCGMTEAEMRGLAKTFYGREPEAMPVDQLALLAGRIESLVGSRLGALHPADALQPRPGP